MVNDVRYDLAECVVTSANDRLILKFLAPGFKEQSYNTVIHAVDLNNFEKVRLRANMTIREPADKYGADTLAGLITRSNELCEATVREAVKSLARQFLTAKHTFNAPLYSITEVELIGFNKLTINGMYLNEVPYGESSEFVVFRDHNTHATHLVNLSCEYLPVIPTNQQLEMVSGVSVDQRATVEKLLYAYVQGTFDPTYHRQVCIENRDRNSGIKAVYEEPGDWVFYDY